MSHNHRNLFLRSYGNVIAWYKSDLYATRPISFIVVCSKNEKSADAVTITVTDEALFILGNGITKITDMKYLELARNAVDKDGVEKLVSELMNEYNLCHNQ